MSGYVEAGYVVCLGTLGCYAVSLVVRERASRQRLAPREHRAVPEATEQAGEQE